MTSQGKAFAEVEAAHFGVSNQLFRRTREQHLAVVNDAGAVDEVERFADIVIGYQHPDAARLQIDDKVANVADRQGVDSGKRFVEQHDRRVGSKRAGDFGAATLAANPSIMLLDEPFAGIDPLSISDIRDLVVDLKTRGIGVLITDHNVRETLDLVDRACIIYDGKVLLAGSPEELVADPEVRRLYLGEGFSL